MMDSFLLSETLQSVAVLHAAQATASVTITASVMGSSAIATLNLDKDETVEEACTKLRERINAH